MNTVATSTSVEVGGVGFSDSPFMEALRAIVRDPESMPPDAFFLSLLEEHFADVPDGTLADAGFTSSTANTLLGNRHNQLLKVIDAGELTPMFPGTAIAAATIADRETVRRERSAASIRAMAGLVLFFTTDISPTLLSSEMGVAQNLPSVHRTTALKRIARDTGGAEILGLLRGVVPLGGMAAQEWLASEQRVQLSAAVAEPLANRRSRRPVLHRARSTPKPSTPKAKYTEQPFDFLERLTDVRDLRLVPGEPAYAANLAKVPLLEPGEVIYLAKKIEKGKKSTQLLEQGRQNGLLSPEQRRVLWNQKQEGDQAKELLIDSNMRLVMSMVRHYAPRAGNIPLSDLISGGRLGLTIAADRFDYKLGNTFSTYAVWQIRKEVVEVITKELRPVTLPAELVANIADYYRIQEGLIQELGHLPTAKEMAQEMGLSLSEVEKMQQYMLRPRSLSELWDADVPVDENLNPEEMAVEADTQAYVQSTLENVLQEMGEDREQILRAAFGLGLPKQTHEELAIKYGLAKGSIYYIVASFKKEVRAALQNLND